MSWFRENSLNWVKRLGIKVLRMGRIPNHIAFIMDGNRRYAEKYKLKRIEGHTRGALQNVLLQGKFLKLWSNDWVKVLRLGQVPNHVVFVIDGNRRYAEKHNLKRTERHAEELADTLEWCRELGIRDVTVYAFSIENFKRSPQEVADLMDLARRKFQGILDEKEVYKNRGIRVRVIGKLSLLPLEVSKTMGEAMKATENNTPYILNIAFSYTSREEITQAVSSIVTGVANGDLAPEDVSKDLISNLMYTSPCSHPELLIRTSGEVRLSDFLLWQTSFSCIYFTEKLWPEFGLWDMLLAILHYQRSYEHLAVYQEGHYSTRIPSRSSAFNASVKESRQL